MKPPLLILSFLPKKMQEKHIHKTWDDRTDKQIMFAYEDAVEWIRLSNGVMASDTLSEIAESCQERLDKWIMPQMEKRGLSI